MSSIEERIRQRRERYGSTDKPQQESPSTPAATTTDVSTYRDRIASRAAKYSDPEVDENYITQFLTDAKAYNSSDAADRERLGFGTSSEIYDSRRQTGRDLSSRSFAIRNYLNKNKDTLPEEYYNEFMSYLDNFDTWSAGSLYNYYSNNRYYSQFESEEHARATQMSLEDIQAEIDRMSGAEDDFGIVQGLLVSNMPYNREYAQQDGRDMAVYDEVERNRQYISEKYGITFTEDYMSNDEQLFALLNRLEEEKSNPVAYTTKDGQNVTWQMLYDSKYASEDLDQRYAAYSQNADWAEMSQGINFVEDTRSDYDIIFELSRTLMPYDRETAEKSGFDMAEFEIIEQRRQYISEKYGVDLYADIYNNVNIFNDLMGRLENQPGQRGNFERLSYLTDEEMQVLNYIYHTQGRAAALAWHNSRLDIYEDRANGFMVENLASWGALSPVLGSVGATALSIYSGFEYLGDIMTYAATGELGDNTSARAAAALQSGVTEKINWEIGNWDAFDFLYGTGMSGINSAASSFFFGPLGGTMLGLGAAAQATNDALDKGMTTGQAFWTGITSGVFEGLFESWSIGKFRGLQEIASANAWDIALNLGKTMLVNASEETITEVANIAYDLIMNGDFSQYETLVRQYVVSGMTETEAKRRAALDLGAQIVESGASGALMGLGFGVTGQAGPIIGNAARSVGSTIQNNAMARGTIQAEGGVDALMALANEMAGVSDSRMQSRLNRQAGRVGENASRRNVRSLYKSVNAASSALNQTDISKRLVENGLPENTANSIAQAIVASSDGKILTVKQQNLLDQYAGDSRVKKALDEAAPGAMVRGLKMGAFQRGIEKGNLKGFAEASLAKQAAPGQENKSSEGNLPGGEKAVSYESSEDGKAHLISDPQKDISIKGIASVEKGSMKLALADGSTVDASDVSFGSEDEAIVYAAVAGMGVSVDTANALVNAFDPGKGVSAAMYALDIREAYNFGRYNYTAKAAENDPYASVKKQAWNDGRIAEIKSSRRDQVNINTAAREAKQTLQQTGNAVRGDHHAVLDDGIDYMDLSETQKASYQLADQIAQAAKVNIRVYNGKGIENGYYSPKHDAVFLNINAINKDGKSLMAFTLGHELVHRAKKGSPAKYQAFADFLMEQYGKQGSDIEDMIGEQLQAAKDNDIEMTRDKAFDEVVADACQRMLLDTDAGKKLARFGAENQRNKSIVGEIRRWIREFMDKLRELFQGVEPDSYAAREFAKFDETVKQILADMYVDMTIDAGEHLSTIRAAFGKDTEVKANEAGEFVMAQNADGSEKIFNLVTWKNGGRETLKATLLREGYTEEDVNAALTIMDGKQKLVEDIASELNENGAMAFPEQGRINEATLTTDIKDGHSVLSALVSNGDYPVNIDLLMVCKKRKAYQRVINRLCETGLIQQATVDALAIAEINKILGKYGFETACLGCFVESRRLRIQEWAQTIVKEWNGEVKKRNPKAKPFGFGKGEAKLDADEIMQLIGELESGGPKNDKGNLNLGQGSAVKRMGVLLDKVPSLARTLSIEDLITPDGLSALRRFDSNLFSMVKSRYGSNSPKFVQEFNPYNHELAMYGKVPQQYNSLREYLYAIGGARMQSFSDFIVENWFDYCQIVADLAARKLPMHTYTKEIALARLFGMTGIKINMSLIPDIDRSLGKEYAGLTRNAKGELELIWADKDRFKATGGKSYMQSINFADAIALQEDPRYSANVGTIAVGISDRHIRMMLNDSRIRMVIPYHASGMNPIFADLMGTSYYKDYTNFQNTTVKQMYDSKGNPVKVKLTKPQTAQLTGGFQFNAVLQELGDARAAAKAYKEWCADASLHTITIKGETYTAELTPKFNDFADETNYYKLLEDFNPYDCITEQAAPQGDVQQIYPEGFEDILRAELSGQERYRQKQEKNQAFDKAMGEIERYLETHSKADTVHYANQHGINLGAKDKKLDAAGKARLKQLQQEGNSFSLPKSNNPYSYKALISKPDMVVTTVGGNVPNDRATLVRMAKQNAAMVGKVDPKSGSMSVYVKDIDRYVGIGRDGLKHSLDGGRTSVNAPVLTKVGEILSNSIRINELTPREDNIDESYVLIGAARNADNELYVVRSVVNRYTHKLVSVDALYAVNAKKEPAALLPLLTGNPAVGTDSTISIAELLDFVNQYFPDILPEEVLKHYGHDSRPAGKVGEDALYKLPVGEDTSPRALLANAFEGVAQGDIEKRNLKQYQENVELLNSEEAKLKELKAEIKELSFAKGPRDKKRLSELRFEAMHTENRIATLDKMLLRFEGSAPLQNILQREKDMVRQRERKKAKDALAEYRREEKAKNEEWQREVREKYQDSRRKVIETRDKRDATDKLMKLVLDTVKWISYPSKTDVKCPDILKKPYADFLNGIDLSSKRLASGGDPTQNDLRLANAMGSLATALERIGMAQDPTSDTGTPLDSGYLDLPAGFVQKLRDMIEKINDMMEVGDFVIDSMTADEVKQLSQMIRTLNHAIKEMSTLYANLRFANVEALGDDSMTFMDDLGEIEKTSGMRDFVEWENALPYYAFKRFGNGGESVFEGLMNAQDKLAFLAQEIFGFRDKTWTDKEAKAWSEDTHTIDLPSGRKLTLTTADAMSIYCLSRRKQGLQHLLGGGVRVVGLQKGSRKAKDSRSVLSIQDIDAINSSLTERQRKVAENIQEFMSTVCSEWGNEISMKRFLTREFTEKHYFPIESNDENLPTKDPSAQQSDLFRLLNISATKPIDPRANNEVIVRNIFDVFTGHASDMARLNAFGMPLLDYMKWLNYREKTANEEGQIKVRGVRKSMETAYGNAAKSYVLNLIKDVNGRPSDGGLPTFYMKMLKNAKTAMVGSSLRVATLQMTSYPRAALVLNPRNLALGLTKEPNIKKAMKYCGIALWKSFGFYDTNISRSIEEQMKGVTDVRQKLIELSLKGAEIGDAITWGALWNACEYEVAATNKYQVGSEEFNKAVGNKLREVVYATQVVDSTLTRSEMMRRKDTKAKELSSFMSEPTLSANILMDAGFQFNLEKRRSGNAKAAWKKTGGYVTKAAAVYAIGQLTAALLEGLWDAARDEDDEKFWEKWVDAFVENLVLDLLPFNKIPIISDIAESVLSLFDFGFFSSENLSSTALTQMVSAVDAWKDVLGGKSSVTVYNAVYKTMRTLSSFYGVSVSGIMRDFVTFWNVIAGSYDSTWKIRSYEPSKAEKAGLLLDALIEGDDRQAESLRAEFADEKAIQSGVRSAVRERFLSGEIDSSTALKYLVLYGGMDAGDARWDVEEWAFEKENEGAEFGKYNEFLEAVRTGENLDAVIDKYTDNGVRMTDLKSRITSQIKDEYLDMSEAERAEIRDNIIDAYVACGETREKAEYYLDSWDFEAEYGFAYSDRRTAYINGEITVEQLRKALIDFGGEDPIEADAQILVYDLEEQGYEIVTVTNMKKYIEFCEPAGVDIYTFIHILEFNDNTKNDINPDTGKEVNYSAVKKVMAEINSLNISDAQKTAIALSLWQQSTVSKYKLW